MDFVSLVKRVLSSVSRYIDASATNTGLLPGILLSLAGGYLAKNVREKHGESLRSKKILLYALPYMVAGGVLYGLMTGLWGLHRFLPVGMVFFMVPALYILSRKFSGFKSDHIFSFAGLILLGGFLLALAPRQISEFIAYLSIAGIVCSPAFLLLKRFDLFFVSAVFGQLMDATTTILALDRGLQETQLVASTFMQFLGPAGIIVLKMVVAIPAVYLISEKSRENREFYLLVAAFLGASIATANLVQLVLV